MGGSPLSRSLALESPAVKRAAAFAQQHLSTIIRSDRETYTAHGLEVAEVLQEISEDPSLAVVAIIHDLEQHPRGKQLLEEAPITENERTLAKRMFHLRGLHVDQSIESLEQLIRAFAEDPRLLLLRMAHRLNDIRHLDRFPQRRRRLIARETLYIYTAISGRLGFQRWRWQMEDTCFFVLHPKIARRMQDHFDACKEIDTACLAHTLSFLAEKLQERSIDAAIDERIKGLYSSFRKMVLKKRSFEELTDRLALRIIVPTVEDCYRALGIIHAYMHPMNRKLKDYIGTPKENGYRSIHTVVYPLQGVTQLPIEIQIRTPAMHRDCEFGIASHGEYKDWSYALTTQPSRVYLFRNLENLRFIARSHRSFTDALRRSFREDRLIVFDSEDRLYHLPKPATALDFACQLSPDDCHRIHAIRINGRTQDLGTLLHDGDIVEVIHNGKTPSRTEQLRSCQQAMTKRLIRSAWAKEKATVTRRAAQTREKVR